MLIDIHSHILPCDHGSDSYNTSLQQLEFAKKHGVTTIVLTPHYDHREESVADFLKRRSEALDTLMNHPNFPQEIRLIAGAEVSLEPGIAQCPDLEKLTIGKSNFILVEFSKFEHGAWAFDALDDIEAKGLKPIIAHLHRYNEETIDYVLRSQYFCQVNASTISSKQDWRRVREWIINHQVHFLGSDIHGAHREYYQFFQKFCKKIPKEDFRRLMRNAAVITQE